MPSGDRSAFGLARQIAGKGTPITTDNLFDYILYTDGAPSPQTITQPLDREVGAGALLRDQVKVGVLSGAQAQFIPRPHTLAELLYAQLGNISSVGADASGDMVDDNWTHTITLPADQFDQPYYTLRSMPGGMWGEQYQDNRLAQLALQWEGADYLRGAMAFQGGLPKKVSKDTWAVDTYLDEGPQFLTPLATIELPTGSPAKVRQGAITFGSSIPLDDQWIVGSYSPDAQDVISRGIGITMVVKVEDDTLYNKMAYDPASGNDWAADIFREADINLNFKSDVDIVSGYATPYELDINANGVSDDTANVVWSVQPIRIQAGRLVTMVVSGVFLADKNAATPISVDVRNGTETY